MEEYILIHKDKKISSTGYFPKKVSKNITSG